MTDRSVLESKVLGELQQIASGLGIEGTQRVRKGDLIDRIVAATGGGDSGSGGSAERPKRQGVFESGATVAIAEPPAQTDAPAPAEAPVSGNGEAKGQLRDPQAMSQQRSRMDEPGNRGGGGGGGGGGGRYNDDRSGRRRGRDRRRGGAGGQGGGQGGGGGGGGGGGRGPGPQMDREATEEELAEAPSVSGILDVHSDGYGFLRTSGYLPGQRDVYVSLSQARRFGLRKGDQITGLIRSPKDSEKYPALLKIDTINGVDPRWPRAAPTSTS